MMLCDQTSTRTHHHPQELPQSDRHSATWFGRNRKGASGQRVPRTSAVPGSSTPAASDGNSSSGAGVGATTGQQCTSTGTAASSTPSDAMSVDQMTTLLRRAPRGGPLPERALAALHHLDSRSVSLMIKDLAKLGADGVATQLFDMLRSLPERHLLRRLCDVYTYTAAISLCIHSQDVERAMGLLEEMRVRDVERNVHTFTALMNICVKCSRLPAALDVYAAMRAEGCAPNVVTFNTLIDVYGKLGQWDQAVGVLKTMRAEVRVAVCCMLSTLHSWQ
jgi:pentatricopeptide repeat domain-containing protein 1